MKVHRSPTMKVLLSILLLLLPHLSSGRMGQDVTVTSSPVTVTLSTASPLNPSQPPFPLDWLGVNLDTASLHNGIDLADPYLVRMLRQLSDAANTGTNATTGTNTTTTTPTPPPIALRVGGTASNAAVYSPDGSGTASTIISDATLDALQAFAVATNANIHPFGLRYELDNATGRWSPSLNASALWARCAAANLTRFTAWSLGNELLGEVNVSLYADDYVAFQGAVAGLAPAWAQTVYGPSAAGFPGEGELGPFLAPGPVAALERSGGALSFHAYSFKDCSLDVYLSKAGMERMSYYYDGYTAVAPPGLPLYLEEFATQAGGGCDGLSDRFASSFWFVHALGLAAEAGIARVTRQDLVGWSFNTEVSRYPLVGPPGWVSTARDGGPPTPHPDWFVALLWRQLVGRRALGVEVTADPGGQNGTLAVHALCARGGGQGAVVLVFLNVGTNATSSSSVSLTVLSAAAGGAGGGQQPVPLTPRVEYILTPPGGNVTADAVLLNGAPLEVDGDGNVVGGLPVVGVGVGVGEGVGADPGLVLPPLSVGFVVLEGAGAEGCAAGG
jgi:hypothetical protein